jgi:hypothetical protein
MHAGIGVPEQTVGLLSVYAIHGLFFVTARRRNGFASVYDLITATRVVQRVAQERRSQQTLAEDAAPQSSKSPMVGPFHVLESLGRQDSEEILLGYDTRLLRKVWIRKQPPGTAPIPAIQRDLTRKGRLHWLAGRRSAEECWDAYEAVAGQPLVSLLHAPQPWKSVRFWLLDLAEELDAVRLDGSSPDTFGLDRVWITADGRAKLLDFPAPGKYGAVAKNSNPSAQQFLSQVAYAGLAGRTPSEANETVPQIPMPLFARAFLQKLPAVPDLPSVLAQLRPLLDKPAEVSSGQRRGLMYMSIFFACLCSGWVSIASRYMMMQGEITTAWWVLGAFAIPSLTASLLFRRGLGLRLLKIEIVTKTGLPAPRWQTFLRCLLAWLPFLLLLLSVALLDRFWPFWIFLASLVGGIIYRLVRPGRAIRDRIVGTWLVPE